MLFFNKAFQLEQDFFSYREIRFEIVQIRISSGLNHYSNQTNMRGLTLQFFDRQKKNLNSQKKIFRVNATNCCYRLIKRVSVRGALLFPSVLFGSVGC